MANNIRKLLATFMVACMLVSALPLQALAAEGDGVEHSTETSPEGITTNVTTTTSGSGTPTVTVTIEKGTQGIYTDAETGNKVTVDRDQTIETKTDADGKVISSSDSGSETKEWDEAVKSDEELAEIPDVTVKLETGEKNSAGSEPKTEGEIVDGNGQITETTTQREVTVNSVEMTQKDNEGHGDMVSVGSGVAPEEYAGKKEIYDEAYVGSDDPNKDLFQGGGLYGGWDMASGWLGYIVEEVDEDGNTKYVLNLDERPLDTDLIEGQVPEYLLVEHGERGAGSKVIVKRVEYQKDADGNVILDEKGEPVYDFGKTTNQVANQGILWGNDGNPYYVYGLGSDDEGCGVYLMSGYVSEELSKAEQFKDDPEKQEHIRGIATHGYWGASNEPDENGNYKTGSLAKIKADMTAAVEAGLTLELNGSTDKEAVLAAIANLTEGDALVATQAALWSYSKGTVEDIDGELSKVVTGEFTNDTNGYTRLIYQYLMGITEDAEHELAAVEKESLNLIVGDKVDEKAGSGIYNAALNFNLSIVPGENDQLNVVLTYKDADGVLQTVTKALGDENSESTVAPNEDGSYTLSGLKLSENQDIEFDLCLEGTQFIEDAVFVYTATHKNNIPGYEDDLGPVGARFATMVGVGEMGAKIDNSLSFSVNFTVDERNHVVVRTEWSKTGEDASEETPDPNRDPEDPYAPTPINRLANAGIAIEEEPVPLAAPVITGDSTGLWIALFLAVALGMVAVNLFDKKRI